MTVWPAATVMVVSIFHDRLASAVKPSPSESVIPEPEAVSLRSPMSKPVTASENMIPIESMEVVRGDETAANAAEGRALTSVIVVASVALRLLAALPSLACTLSVQTDRWPARCRSASPGPP